MVPTRRGACSLLMPGRKERVVERWGEAVATAACYGRSESAAAVEVNLLLLLWSEEDAWSPVSKKVSLGRILICGFLFIVDAVLFCNQIVAGHHRHHCRELAISRMLVAREILLGFTKSSETY